jgi:hypothetical protein
MFFTLLYFKVIFIGAVIANIDKILTLSVKQGIKMSVILEDRPIETVRSEVIDQLIMNYSHGELSYQAFERRLDEAMESQCNKALVALTNDLPLTVDKAFVESKKQDLAPNFVPSDTEELDYMVNIFSGSNRGGAFKLPKELRYISIFSGTEIDLTHAQFCQDVVRIKIFSLFSGDSIYVPENVNVISKAFCIFGSIDNSVATSTIVNNNAPTIIIEGLSIFSGVDIEIKRTIKEKFVDMADSFKKMFS